LGGDRLPDGRGSAGTKGRAVFRSGFPDRLHEVGFGCRNLAKDAMRHFGKSRTVRSSRVPERFFVKIPGKISGEIVLGKIW
jgi:hypothetical protein